jgi:hypothetical protein
MMDKKTTSSSDPGVSVIVPAEVVRQAWEIARARASAASTTDSCPEHGYDDIQVGVTYRQNEDGSWVGITEFICGGGPNARGCGYTEESEWPLTRATIGPFAPRAARDWLSKRADGDNAI